MPGVRGGKTPRPKEGRGQEGGYYLGDCQVTGLEKDRGSWGRQALTGGKASDKYDFVTVLFGGTLYAVHAL